MQDLASAEIDIDYDSVFIRNFVSRSPELLKYFKSVEGGSIAQRLDKLLEIGALVLNRVETNQELDYVEGRIKETLSLVQENYRDLLNKMTDQLEASLNPNHSGSFLQQTQKLILDQTQYISQSLIEVLRSAQIKIEESASKVDTGRFELDRKFDPNNKVGYLNQLIEQINGFERKINSQFSETDSASFVGKLKTNLNNHFGENGQVLSLIESKFQLNGSTPLNQVYCNLKQEISSLRDLLMKLIGQQELLQETTKKGFPFEHLVFEKLQDIARPFNDLVEDTSLKVVAISGSKKGDYVYSLFGTDTKIVLDAKNYNKLKSLPAMLAYIQEAMIERDAKFGIIVAPDVASLQKQIGSWNVYGSIIITPIDYLEMSIKYARYALQFEVTTQDSLNSALIKQKLDLVQRKIKEVTSIKTKLTKLSNGVVTSVDELQKILDALKSDISDALTEVEKEFLKAQK